VLRSTSPTRHKRSSLVRGCVGAVICTAAHGGGGADEVGGVATPHRSATQRQPAYSLFVLTIPLSPGLNRSTGALDVKSKPPGCRRVRALQPPARRCAAIGTIIPSLPRVARGGRSQPLRRRPRPCSRVPATREFAAVSRSGLLFHSVLLGRRHAGRQRPFSRSPADTARERAPCSGEQRVSTFGACP